MVPLVHATRGIAVRHARWRTWAHPTSSVDRALVITEKKAVKEILEHLGLPATGPSIAPARMPEAGEDIRWQDDVPELQQSQR